MTLNNQYSPMKARENTSQLMLSTVYCISLLNLVVLIFVMALTSQFELKWRKTLSEPIVAEETCRIVKFHNFPSPHPDCIRPEVKAVRNHSSSGCECQVTESPSEDKESSTRCPVVKSASRPGETLCNHVPQITRQNPCPLWEDPTRSVYSIPRGAPLQSVW